MIRTLRILARIAFVAIVLVAVVGGAGAGVTLAYFSRDLPDDQQLLHYVPAIGSKMYAGDGSFMAEFASEHRIFVPLAKIPPLITHAFLAAEDRDFYSHNGVNPGAVFRAAMSDVLRLQKGQRPLGASTITQQVVRHFLLTNEVSVSRKIKEALLAYRIEKVLSKDQILEIYLNEIYLGAGAYGVEAAAQTYFQKPLDKLTPAEAALLAALPKAPNNYNPIRNPQLAKSRRDWVLAGMAEVGFLNKEKARIEIATPLGLNVRQEASAGQNGYFAEEVRRELIARFGEKAVYEGGLTIKTSYSPSQQVMAERAFRDGLIAYDRRHGWRGPVQHLANAAAAEAALAGTADHPGIETWRLAAVTAIEAGSARIVLKDGGHGRIPAGELGWARYGRHPVVAGDIVYVEPLGGSAAPAAAPSRRQKAPPAPAVPTFGLRQIPEVSGGFVALDPKTGRVLAMIGGWDFQQSQFNRVTQAMRQPGSSIKPLVYVSALQNGYTPDSMVNDSPIEISQGPGQAPWRPVNYEGNAVGPTTLRDALIHSRNLATANLALSIGLPAIAKTVEGFDVMDRMPLYPSMALGAGETTVMRMATAYAMLDNGGHWLLSSVIDTVQDRDGRVVYQKGVGSCAACFVAVPSGSGEGGGGSLFRADGAPKPSDLPSAKAKYADGAVLYRPTKPDPLVSPTADAEIISMMQGVVQQGTGIAVAAVGKPIAGKTGTTSDWKDAWFVGFSPGLAAGVYVGFDDPRSLGNGEVGGHVAAPIFRDFMTAALKDQPATPFEAPPGADPALIAAVPVAKANWQQAWANGGSDGQNDAPYQGTQPWNGAVPGTQTPAQTADDPASPYTRQPPPLPWQAAAGAYATDESSRYGKQRRSYQSNPYAEEQGNPYPAPAQPYVQTPDQYADTNSKRSRHAPDPYWQAPSPYRQEPNTYDYNYRQPQSYRQPSAQYAREPMARYGTVAPQPYYWQGPTGWPAPGYGGSN
ncbi:MAG TPA: PBP1A family penicillin-binding protein [Stellaceae bacterium]|nr:PBP1A family penicillin-binding protein [Stellaceae bacterium]